MFKKIAFVVAFAALTLGCHKHPTAHLVAKTPEVAAEPEPPKFEVVKPKAVVPPPFTLQSMDGWSLVNYTALPPDEKESQVIAIFENDLDEELSVRAAVIASNLNEEEASSFLDEIRELAHSRDNAKVLKERIIRLDGVRAYEFLEARITSAGPQIFVTLATTNGKLGFVMSCGGSMEEAERVLPVCADFVEGFRIRK